MLYSERMTFMHRVGRVFTAQWSRFIAFGRRVGWGKVSIAVVVLVILLIVVRSFFGSTAATTVLNTIPQVTVSSVADLSNQTNPLSIVGTVQSTNEATVNAETSGSVTAVYHTLGDYVAAGTILAELENSSQRAAVQQAQGGVDAAQAALNKISVGTESNKSASVNALLSAYSSVDSAIRGTSDPMFSNPTTNNPQFTITSSNSQLVSQINSTRPTLSTILTREHTRVGTLSENDDIGAELNKTIDEVRTIRNFLDSIVSALNNGIPGGSVSQSTIDADLAAATAARTSLTTTLSSLTAAQSAFTNAQQSGSTGSSPDVAAGKAALTQAQGALAAARANLEKSILRAPISGTVNKFSLKRGDFVSQFSAIATIANNGALEIVAYLSQQDTNTSAVGDKVTIEGGNTGIITHIAPALDPVTKKIEVRIGVSNSASLVNGQSVIVTLPHSNKPTTSKPNAAITIPITALKIGATDTTVFTVASSTLVAHTVTIGELLGDRVVIVSGLTPDMTIVTDARGLREGETIEIVTQ